MLWANEDSFKIKCPKPSKELAFPDIRLDIDTLEDYERLLSIPYNINMNSEEIIEQTILKG